MPFTNPKLSMGQETLEMPNELFATNRERLVDRLIPITHEENSVVLLQGGTEIPIYDTDCNYLFRQESYFRWAFGVTEPNCYGAIEVCTGDSYLFVPNYSEAYAIWMGRHCSPEEFKEKYGVDHVHYVSEICGVLSKINSDDGRLLILHGINSDSGLEFSEVSFEGIDRFRIDGVVLYQEMAYLRSIKTDYEVAVMNYVTAISAAGHREVMKSVNVGTSEYQCEADFLHYIYKMGGCRHVAYTCICASGPNSAILHYGHAGTPNDRVIKDGDMCLFDMGASYFGYASNITCTFPANGKFTPDQKLIYEAVLKSNVAVTNEVKPGANWGCLHLLGLRVLLGALKDGGLLKGDVSAMVTAGLGRIFQPHGLGHLIGLDVHDVGGYLGGSSRALHPKGMNLLRTTRVLEEGMAVTIEPGCYFIDCLLDHAFNDEKLSKFLIEESIARFRGFGGVRIEDDVIVTETGAQNMAVVPRTVEEIEKFMAATKGDDDPTP